ncbi:MAG: AI-2E family transporter [Deltaproteobacteria bacterium]|nr:AI-2E family transporter [Deltaproteobacteria bacterium]
MNLGKSPYTFDRVVRIVLAAGLLWGGIRLLGLLSDVLIPFAVALLLAYLINPLVVRVQRKISHRGTAVVVSLILILLFSGLLAAWLTPMVTKEISHMGSLLSGLVNNSDIAERASKELPPDLWKAVREYASQKEIQDLFNTANLWKIAVETVRKVLPGIWGLITGTASFLLGLAGLVVILLYLIFLLIDFPRVREGWKSMIPPGYREQVVAFVHDFDAAMNRYFRAQAAVAALVGVLFATGFTLIGLPLGILLGLFIGLLNMIPYLQLIGLIPAFLLAVIHALETGGSLPVTLALTGLVFVGVQLIQDTILVPRLMGKVTGLSPAMILLSLSIWGKLLGIFGLIIALPMTCLLLAYYQRFLLGPAEVPAGESEGS